VLLCAGMSLGPPCTHAQDTVRVLSYNIRHGAGMDGRVDLERTADVIRAFAPHVVLLQEVDSCTARTGGIDQAGALAELAELPHYAFGRFMEYEGGAYGMAILSATPILQEWNHELPGGTEPRSALAARIRPSPSTSELVFVGIHLYRTEVERFEQARRIIDRLGEETAPVLLVGDFNSQPGDAVMRLLGGEWKLPSKPADDRRTWPADTPRVEIDHAMYRPEERIEVLDYRVIDERLASDHRPVLLLVAVR
jgi:endonuclease/exonuclease/phosphatase family metal-dependent hydrolase